MAYPTNVKRLKVTFVGTLTDLNSLLGLAREKGVEIEKQGSFCDPNVVRKGPNSK